MIPKRFQVMPNRAFLHEEMATLDDDEVSTLASAVQILDRLIEQVKGR